MKRVEFNPWRELAALAVLVMEVAWVTVWLRLLMRPSAQVGLGRTLALLLAFSLTTYAWAHVGALFSLRRNLLRGGLLALLPGGVLAGWAWLIAHRPDEAGLEALVTQPLRSFADLHDVIPPQVVVLFAVLALWWLSTRLAGVRVGPMIVGRRFRFGVGFFALWAALTLGRMDTEGLGLFALFVGAALVAMAAARVAVISLMRGGRRSPFTRRWLGSLFGAVGGLVLVAGGLAVALAGPLTRWTGVLLARTVQGLAVLVSSPFLALLIAIAPWLEGLREMFMTTAPPQPTVTPMPDAAEQLRQQMEQMAAQSPAVAPNWGLIKGLLLLMGVVLVVALVLRGAGAVGAGRTEAAEEGLEDVERGGLWRRVRRALQGGAGGGGRRLGAAARRRAAARIRRIYADLLALGARIGHPRPPEATPLEYIPLLAQGMPGEEPALQEITRAYLRVRYGELPETAAEIRAVERAWASVRRAARRRNHKVAESTE